MIQLYILNVYCWYTKVLNVYVMISWNLNPNLACNKTWREFNQNYHYYPSTISILMSNSVKQQICIHVNDKNDFPLPVYNMFKIST